MKLKLLCLLTFVLLTLPEWRNLSEGAAARKSTVKPGVCPPLPEGSIGHCAEYCTNDRECPNQEKCCSNGCGHVCMIPYTVKRGRCSLPMQTSMCEEYCYYDGECPGEQKCCRTKCGHACSKPR